jgi:hypothetical protein
MEDPPQWCKGIWPPGKMSRLSDLLRQFLSNHDA